jgi:GTP-binding protein
MPWSLLLTPANGLSVQDHEIAKYLRRLGKTCVLVANKAEGMHPGAAIG